MAQKKPASKPRLRKTAPTIKERAELHAKKRQNNQKASRKLLRKIGSPFLKVRLPRNRATAPVYRVAGLFKRLLIRLVPRYFVNSWHEVKQVTWPGRKETWRLTGAVFIFAIVFGASVALVDKGLESLFRQVILK